MLSALLFIIHFSANIVMKNILVINDRSAEADNAIAFALELANNTNSGLLLWNTFEQPVPTRQVAYASAPYRVGGHQNVNELSLSPDVWLRNHHHTNVSVENYYTSNFTASHIAEFAIKKNVWMIVKGTTETNDQQSVFENDHTQAILNSANCPILLIPQKADKRKFEKMVYTADLRYCRLEVLHMLVKLAQASDADVMVAHIAAKGLPDVSEQYASDVFANEITNNVKYPKLYFNHIKERDIPKAVDVMVDVMGADLLVLVNHKFHFEEIVGRKLSGRLPEYLHIPLLVFPS